MKIKITYFPGEADIAQRLVEQLKRLFAFTSIRGKRGTSPSKVIYMDIDPPFEIGKH